MERFINQKVNIKKTSDTVFEEGIITAISKEDGLITIKTKSKEREFDFATVDNGVIRFVDKELQSIAPSFFRELKDCYEKMQNEKDEENIERIKNEYVCRIRRDIGDSNVAFKCTFCNGGSSDKNIGFIGPCTPELREFNVEHRTWCGSNSCRCRKLMRNEIDQITFDRMLESDKKEDFLCYESKMFVDWVCYAGMKEKTGEPMALNKAQVGSLAVLTTRPVVNGIEVSQEETQIIGVFLIAKHDDKSSIGGSVSAHDKYRISLTPDESKRMLLWKYHSNENKKEKPFWGSGLHRYLSDMECCQILKDIVDVVIDKDKKRLAQELLDKFTEETGITIISNPSGAI